MDFLKDRRVLAGFGAGGAAVLAVVAALLLSRSPKGAETAPAPVESSNMTGTTAGGLKVEMGKAPKLEADTSVRCFVNGQFVGMQTASACAQKNGVAPGALDVGLDQSGAIAAGGGDTRLSPMAAAHANEDGDGDEDDDRARGEQAGADPTQPVARDYAATPPSPCRRYAGGGWRPAGEQVSLDACVHTLFDGRCPPAGQVVYGHWGALTLRASPGRIDVSADNRDFRPLAPQYPEDCSIPSL